MFVNILKYANMELREVWCYCHSVYLLNDRCLICLWGDLKGYQYLSLLYGNTPIFAMLAR